MAALIKIDHSFTTRAARADILRFCTRCGEPAESPPRDESPLTQARVCDACGMGVLLSCTREALPGARAAFLIATVELKVNAVSVGAEEIFGPEPGVIGSYLLDLMTSPMGDAHFAKLVTGAAVRSRDPVVMPVKSLGSATGYVGMLAARVSTCGPPRAALVTVEPSGFGRAR
jgi:hypothetical protein